MRSRVFTQSTRVSVRYISGKGIGVVATEDIPGGGSLPELYGFISEQPLPLDYTDIFSDDQLISLVDGATRNSVHVLTGTLSYVNHSCFKHSNVTVSPLMGSNWSHLQVLNDGIKKGEEVEFCYSDQFKDLPCEKCNQSI
jgi:hypothetical protein